MAEAGHSVGRLWADRQLECRAQDWPAALYVVAGPIGNLADLSMRAWTAISLADTVLAEDTRVSRRLLSSWGLNLPVIACHRHNEGNLAARVQDGINTGQRWVLLSDAGTPAVSDPGARLVAMLVDAGVRVIPIPGPSAVLAALMVSGLTDDGSPCFGFSGFVPSKAGERERFFATLLQATETRIFFEAPHRIRASIQALCSTVQADRVLVVARELTKRHETVTRASAADWLHRIDSLPEMGEYVLILGPCTVQRSNSQITDDARALLRDLLQGFSIRDAARIVARHTGCPREQVYAEALTLQSALREANDGD